MNIPSWLLQNAVIATLAAGLLALALRWWKPSAGIEHLLWVAILVKFVLPPIAVLPLPSAFSSIFSEEIPSGADARPPAIAPRAPGPSGAIPSVAPASPVPMSEVNGQARTDAAAGIMDFLLLAWLSGGLLVSAGRARKYLEWHRRIALDPVPPSLHSIVVRISGDLGMRPPMVYACRDINSPLVMGLLRPRLLWPSALIDRLGPEQVLTVVAHELAHVRRGDLWVSLVDQIVSSIWWWYPGPRLVSRRLRDAAERACDARVVELLPCNRRAYAEALLDVLESQSSGFSQPSLALGLDGPGPIRRRLQQIMGSVNRTSAHAAGVALLIAGAGLITAWRVSPVQPRVPMAAGQHFSGVASRGEVGLVGSGLP
ncbi:MAG: M56 family metallopeptidase, partial [Gemmatimonadales bacterium]